MGFTRQYLLPRLLQHVLVVFCGITAVFFITRFAPKDPVLEIIGQLQAWGRTMDPKALERTIQSLRELYGLEGTLTQQYLLLWRRIFTFDFGPSLFQFPTPVLELIRTYLPWTVFLFFTTTCLQWILGNLLGSTAGYFAGKYWSRILESALTFLRPLPHYLVGLLLLILFGYVWQVFPVGRGLLFGKQTPFGWLFIVEVLRHSFLPALTTILLGSAMWFQQMKLLTQNLTREAFVEYAKLSGVHEYRIVAHYVIPNAMLPQITQLALMVGQVFGGMLVVEIVFSYPGMGTLLYNAILKGDYNLIMAITTFSILFISAVVLCVDLLYPFFDPRIRYR
ncbi:MAG: ABC transporter permease [Candidatus Caldatribacterium sp.]|uniref:ABC transporter permease n=1 Tax=Candidatus Caldatribacterium sp. TaxID=2282143 RepID=UPI002997D814|nr:ABC transporter permease [Candidatus Caldatribacterium sp.]MCX7730536.1 ABC transporter permease [Candidatus Caldatribacterium sp.]MDW8081631.1 ABC transporter permease [Candidatus Calescibacterium sp.]